MPSSPLTEAPDAAVAFVCDCGERLRSACKGLPFYKAHEGKRYCVLHYPGKDKSSAFNEALKRKLEAEDFDFSGVWFPDDVSFVYRTFAKPVTFDSATFRAEAVFDSATFRAATSFNRATFSAEASFNPATFSVPGAYFNHATFSAKASFYSATFRAAAIFSSATFSAAAYFNSATFRATAYFNSATFSAEAYFNDATFSAKANFNSATFRDYVRFEGKNKDQVFGDQSSLMLESARIEKPDHLSFHTLPLRPHWFVNVDARRFEFIHVDWNWRKINTKQEIKSSRGSKDLSAHRLLARACRNLAVNAEENHQYEDASRFRYMTMDALRLERWRGFAFWRLGWWYWLASGYGERVWHAFLMLFGIWVLFAVLYVGLGFPSSETKLATEQAAAEAQHKETSKWPQWSSALLYSAGVMILQKPEPRPATNAAQSLVMLETILGPVQAALLALAIRRKFMR